MDRSGAGNPNWKGDTAGYFTRHSRVKNTLGSASSYQCHFCSEAAMDWAQLHDTDGLNVRSHYVPACRSCHLKYDRVGNHNGHVNRTEYARGEQHGNAKLTKEKVLDIRERAGEDRAILAKEFAVSRSCIDMVIARQRWKHI